MSQAHTDRNGRITLHFDSLDEYREFVDEIRTTQPRQEQHHGRTSNVSPLRRSVACH
jgi:hypothetical protein